MRGKHKSKVMCRLFTATVVGTFPSYAFVSVEILNINKK